MDISSIATMAMAASQSQLQIALAAKFAKMNAGAEQAVATLLEGANQNMQQITASLASGVGSSLDISI